MLRKKSFVVNFNMGLRSGYVLRACKSLLKHLKFLTASVRYSLCQRITRSQLSSKSPALTMLAKSGRKDSTVLVSYSVGFRFIVSEIELSRFHQVKLHLPIHVQPESNMTQNREVHRARIKTKKADIFKSSESSVLPSAQLFLKPQQQEDKHKLWPRVVSALDPTE